MINRPEPGEYADFYSKYVACVPEGDVLERLNEQAHAMQVLMRGIGEDGAGLRYADGKWSIKDVLGHLIDAERIFCTRALRFARGDETELPGFDQDDFVANANFDGRKLSSLMAEYAAVRQGTLLMFQSFKPQELERSGIANGKRVSVRALAWIITGHERHHQRLLRERYLNASAE